MTSVSVYRVDYVRKTRVRIGTVVERRKRERGHNLTRLLHLARKMFAASPQEAFWTALDVQDVRPAWRWEGAPSHHGERIARISAKLRLFPSPPPSSPAIQAAP